jgi:hypothetical protein
VVSERCGEGHHGCDQTLIQGWGGPLLPRKTGGVPFSLQPLEVRVPRGE